MTKNAFIFIGVFMAAIGLGVVAYLYSKSEPAPGGVSRPGLAEQANVEAFQGLITEINADSGMIAVRAPNGEEVRAAQDANTRFYDKEGRSVDLAYLRKGYRVNAVGTKTGEESMLANEIRVLTEPNIIMFFPETNQIIGLPLHISGEARVFERVVSYRLRDESGDILVEGRAAVESPDGRYGPFDASTSYARPQGGRGVLEVFNVSARDGLETDKVEIPVRFASDQPSTAVKAFFPNRKLDPGAEDCSKAYPVERRVARTAEPARAALSELLAGPTRGESDDGYFTTLNLGVKLQGLTIRGGVAYADFDATLENAVGGSCRVQAIRSQITQTLRQFTNIEQAVISINGRTEDILQP